MSQTVRKTKHATRDHCYKTLFAAAAPDGVLEMQNFDSRKVALNEACNIQMSLGTLVYGAVY